MPVKMISTRACYVPSSHREFEANQNFDAVDEREADRLTRQKRAKRVVESKAKPADPLNVRRKVLSLKDEPATAQSSQTSGSYSRRDMRAEDE